MATVPTVTDWAAGEVLTGARMNAHVKDPLAHLLSPPRATMSRVAVQAIPASTYTYLQFDTENVDTDGMINLATLSHGMTVQTAGQYDITCGVTFATSGTGGRICRIMVNDFPIRVTAAPGMSANKVGLQVSAMNHPLSVGDTLKVTVWSGVALDTGNGTGEFSWLAGRWVGP